VYTIDESILAESFQRARFIAAVAVRAHINQDGSAQFAVAELRALAVEPLQPVDLFALRELLLDLAAAAAGQAGCPVSDVIENASRRVVTDARGRRILGAILAASMAAWHTRPAAHVLLLGNSGWNQTRWEYLRLSAAIVMEFGLHSRVEARVHELNVTNEPFSAVRVIGDLRQILRRPGLGSTDRRGGVGEEVGALVDELAETADQGTRALLMKFANLRSDLELAKAKAPDVAGNIITRYLAADHGSLLGFRAELRTLASIVSAGVEVTSGQTSPSVSGPDFVLPEFEVVVEATSCRMGDGTNYVRKFWQKIHNKSKEEYTGPATVLTVDITALLATAIDNSDPFDQHRLRLVAMEALDEGTFGAVVLQFTVLDRGSARDLILRCTGPHATIGVQQAIDRIWPLSSGSVRGPLDIPHMS